MHMKNSSAQERISHLEQQLEESKKRHANEITEMKQTNANLSNELRHKTQELSNEAVKIETLGAEYSRLKLELNRTDSTSRQRIEALERELADAKIAAANATASAKAAQQKSEYETMMIGKRVAAESGEKFEVEIKLLNGQVATLVS